jgi:hypothetical protein
MRRARAVLAGLALSGALSLVVHAQGTPETVIVEGHRPTEEEMRAAVSRFVDAHADFTVKLNQLSRWNPPRTICPKVVNLPKEFGAFISARIRAVARAVRAPIKEPCEPNVTIIYTPNPQGVLDDITARKPELLGYHADNQAREVARVTRPIQAWYVTASSNGFQTVIDSPYTRTPSGMSGSRLSVGLRSDILHVLIVIDARKLEGYEVGPVADHIAMLALSHAQAPDDCTKLPTILNYLTPDCPAANKPDALTAADRAYLEGLYLMPAESLGRLQRAAILNHMNRALGSGDGEPDVTAAPAE